jgi:hypothetical protein
MTVKKTAKHVLFPLHSSRFPLLPEAISRLTFKAVYRYPFTVHRLSHLMTSKALTHGSRFTVHGHTVSGKMDAPIASS